jgi:hypothetical protein
MLQRTSLSETFDELQQPRIYRGKDVVRQARHGTATERAVLAAELTGATIVGVTAELATAQAGANRLYAAECRGMTPLELAAVKAGSIKLSDRVRSRRKSRPITDEEFDALVVERAERALAVLDQLTSEKCEQQTSNVQS